MDNPILDLARDFVEHTAEHIFLTGRAGTGKTTFLHRLRERSPKRMVVVAPTGVAAINAGGVTMHSFFQLPFGIHIPGATRKGEEIKRFGKVKIAIIKSIDLLVIDEISMVRADTLDNVDEVLRRFRDRNKPFGGVQLLMIGDVQQLSPVVRENEWEILRDHYRSPYFFDSHALREAGYRSIELRHIYRQTDEKFIDMLSRVRDNRIDSRLLEALNSRHREGFDPPQSEGYITLTSHNSTARAINDRKLSELPSREYSFEAEIQDDFPEGSYPVEKTLRLKQGAQVMFTKNDHHPEHRYINGTIGTVTVLRDDYIEVQPAAGGDPIAVEPADWSNTSYTLDPLTKELTEHVDGVFTQYPLKTAWAITIHKSQGLTFERAIIDAADSFSHGQVYVALSRCRSLEGLVLRSPLSSRAIISDPTVDGFSRHVETNQPGQEELRASCKLYYENLLHEMFDFTPLDGAWRSLGRFMEETLWRTYPKLCEKWKADSAALHTDITGVGLKFRIQLSRIFNDGYLTDPVLAGRVKSATEYFLGHCSALVPTIEEAAKAQPDNKEQKKRYGEQLQKTVLLLQTAIATLTASQNGFSVPAYLEARAQANAGTGVKDKRPKTPKKEDPDTNGDILNPELFELLREWRNQTARQLEVPVYVVTQQKSLIEISNTLPSTEKELKQIKGIGKNFMEKYAGQVLALISDYRTGKIG